MKNDPGFTSAQLNDLRILGDHLRTARIRRRLPQTSWAEAMNSSVATIKRMERGCPRVAMSVYISAIRAVNHHALQKLLTLLAPENDLEGAAIESRKIRRRARQRARKHADAMDPMLARPR